MTSAWNPLNYLKAVFAAIGMALYPLVDWLVGMIPNIPDGPHTSADVVIMAIVTGGIVYGVPNQNQPSLTAGQVVVNKADIHPSTPIAAEHQPLP